MLPEFFQEQCIRLYTKEADPEQRKLLKHAFYKWCKQEVYPVPIGKFCVQFFSIHFDRKTNTYCRNEGTIDDGWLTCDFTSFFNSFAVISGRVLGDNESLCAMDPRLCLKRFLPGAYLEPATARPAYQC